MQKALSCTATWNLPGYRSTTYVNGNVIHRLRPYPRGLTAMLISTIRFLQAWKRYNRSLSELSRLGDRDLADIGISRSDIPRIAWESSQH
jgi:uncharacterized protein YjiS (DUF1127 family)